MRPAERSLPLRCARLLRVLASIFVLPSACAPAHVVLVPPPPRESALEVRRAYYVENRPIVVRGADALTTTRPPVGARKRSFLVLADGTRVEHASDLVANVDDDSAAARSARRANDADGLADAWIIGTTVALATGTAMSIAGLALSPEWSLAGRSSSDDLAPFVVAVVLDLGALVLFGGGLFSLFAAEGAAANAAQERDAAFLAYDKSLRQRLSLTPADLGPADRGPATQDSRGVIELHGGAPHDAVTDPARAPEGSRTQPPI